MGYQPIENYGIIGNMKTIALVGKNGSIDWFCFPRIDSSSVFGSILDDKIGGYFSIAPEQKDFTSKQFYWPETNVLVSQFYTSTGVLEVIDFMPLGKSEIGSNDNRLVRKVKVLRGLVDVEIACKPAFDYARAEHSVVLNEHGAAFHSPELSLGLLTSVPLVEEKNAVKARLELKEGESVNLVVAQIESVVSCPFCYGNDEAEFGFKETVSYWRNWLQQCTYKGRWREMIHRSALTLKLLTVESTGAIVAAATTSLPEGVGGERNWDYRFTWIRDAAFTIYGLMRIGFTEEANDFMKWVEARCAELNQENPLQIMYGVDGRHDLTEETLDHLSGYMNSKPVRIGNGAYDQLQLDIYGELLDSVYLFNKYGTPISYDLWTNLQSIINWVCENWQRTDEGIWEVRGGQRKFVYSRLMSWVAVDRGLRLAEKRSFPADREHWTKVRDEIFEDIMVNGWSEERQAFIQSYGSHSLDASNLMMPLVFFVSPSDPRMLKTLDAINKPPEEGGLVSNGLVFRYNPEESPDGLEGTEGTFNICTFWMVEALTRAGRTDAKRLEEARLMFEQMLGYANHLGLYAEETGSKGEALGNFPQAFTHLSLISAAYNLDKALD